MNKKVVQYPLVLLAQWSGIQANACKTGSVTRKVCIMLKKLLLASAITSSLLSSAAALAQTALPQTEGEVRRVDARAQTVTLKHGEIKNLDMPPMTMVFQVSDPALLGKVKAGDKVRFTADKVNGTYTVLSLEVMP